MTRDTVLCFRHYAQIEPIGSILATTLDPKLWASHPQNVEFTLLGRVLVLEVLYHDRTVDENGAYISFEWYTVIYPDNVGFSFRGRVKEERPV